MTRHLYPIAMALAIGASLLLIWLSLGVGIIGADGDPANAMYFGVIAVGLIGAAVVRLRAAGMSRTLFAMALVQALIAAIALIARIGLPWSGPAEIALLNAFFIALFVVSGRFFAIAAARGEREGDAP